MTDEPVNELSRLPQLDAILQAPDAAQMLAQHGQPTVANTARAVIDEARAAIRAGAAAPSRETLFTQIAHELAAREQQRVQRVVNATGVLLHTNLGRAPLSAAAREAVARAAGYASVELDLDTGRRGSRTASVGVLAAEASGTAAATVVNNGAAALMLVLAALATNRDTIVSRGELIEIGGSYRLPEVMGAAGTRLVEVGTTNRTHLADYRSALAETTGVLLKVHRSNYRVIGFTADVELDALVELGRQHNVPVVYDLGSGLLRASSLDALADEPSVASAVAAGADLVIYSGDKLLGGPQAGIIAGDAELIRACARHPLARAVRVDKLQRAALEATLVSHLRGDSPVDLPTWAMLHTDRTVLHERATRIVAAVAREATVVPVTSLVGGGASPSGEMASWGVAIPATNPDRLAAALRRLPVPVIGVIREGSVVLDLRTVAPADDETVIDALRSTSD